MTELVKSPGKALFSKIDRDQSLSVSFPNDLHPDEVIKWSRVTAAALDHNDGQRAVLLGVAGRLHHLARINPEVLVKASCESLDDYLDTVLNCRNHRSTVYKFSSSYETFPDLPPAKAESIGTDKLVRAAKVAKSIGASPQQKEEILVQAETLSTSEFKQWADKAVGGGTGATTGAMFELYGSAEEVRELKEELAEEGFVEFAGSSQPIKQVLAAVAESRDLWPVKSDEDRRLIHVKTTVVEKEPEPEIDW